MNNNIRPLCILNGISNNFPNAWKMVEYGIMSKGNVLPSWDNWCFLPIEAWDCICKLSKADTGEKASQSETLMLAAVGTWRYSQGIYRFDEDFRSCLINTELHGAIPTEVLMRLPEFCIYLETPGLKVDNQELYGCWVHLARDMKYNEVKMHLLLDGKHYFLPISFKIDKLSLIDAIKCTLEELNRLNVAASLSSSLNIDAASLAPKIAADIMPILSMVLYLCSENREVTDRSNPDTPAVRPTLKKTRHGNRLFPPCKARIWEIGNEIGRRLRTAKSLEKGEGHSNAVHLRRGHWHTYWTGPRNQEQVKILRWLPPMIVGMADNYHEGNLDGLKSKKAAKRAKRHS